MLVPAPLPMIDCFSWKLTSAKLARGGIEQGMHAALHGSHLPVDDVHHEREAAEDEQKLERDGQQQLGEGIVPRRDQQPRVDGAEEQHREQVDEEEGEQQRHESEVRER